jgi:15-cis-phytoene synthase
MTGPGQDPGFREEVIRGLLAEAERWSGEPGFPRARVEGKLLRPLLAAAAKLPPGSPPVELRGLPGAFWSGALAIQMVHEASLLHDDILDQAPVRRGRPTVQSALGMHVALVQGDHLLTAAYRLAAETGSVSFFRFLTRAVERTVAGEKAQGASRGRWLSEGEYREMVSWKSGELFGCALALGRCLEGDEEGAEADYRMGIRVGCLYQMVDDFLDLCPGADCGKPAFQDLSQEKWTWPLAEAGVQGFGSLTAEAPDEIAALLFHPEGAGASPMRRALRRLRVEVEGIRSDWLHDRPGEDRLPEILDGWLVRAEAALVAEEDRGEPPRIPRRGEGHRADSGAHGGAGGSRAVDSGAVLQEVRAEAMALGREGDWLRYFAHHARSFRFAARLFPREEGRLVAGVYAFCRFTDDLVDRAPHLSREALAGRLDAWMHLTRMAYDGGSTGVPLLDGILGETATRGVPLHYAEELIRGVGMDLDPPRYRDLDDLRRYSYRVASVVGLWLTELFGTRTPWVLRRAEAMGHAMQLTNILRDVGEDLRQGRIYLPETVLQRHGVSPEAMASALAEGGLPQGWVGLMEELMAVADAEYGAAIPAIPALPRYFQGPVVVAARVYQGIHGEIRRNGHDTLHRRAHTSLAGKVRLGAGALVELRRARRSRVWEGALAGGASLPALPGA